MNIILDCPIIMFCDDSQDDWPNLFDDALFRIEPKIDQILS
jgi:hypothetical protein